MWEIKFSQVAKKDFEKLPLDVQGRILSKLDRIRIRPYSFVKRLIGSDYFRLRVGDYRLILDLKNRELIIIIIEVGHRKNIYK